MRGGRVTYLISEDLGINHIGGVDVVGEGWDLEIDTAMSDGLALGLGGD